MRKRSGLIGGALGLVAATAAVAVTLDKGRTSRRRAAVDFDSHEFGALPADRTGTVAAEDGTALHYEEIGPRDAPLTVVFVHGFALQLGAFHFQRRALGEQFGTRVRMVFFDQRSHGRSERSDPERANIDQLGRDLASVLDVLVPRGPMVLVGHSLGGMVIMALADAHPELFRPDDVGPARVAAVALLATSTGKLADVTVGLPALLARLRGPLLPMLLRGARRQANLIERGRALGTDIAWVITRRLSFAGDDIHPATVEYLASMIASTRIEVIADFFPALMNHDKLAALPTFEETDVLIMGGDHDLLTPPEHSEAMGAELPKAELIIVPQGGHVALMEHPAVFCEALGRLIERALAEVGGKRRWRRR
ncbi:MAG: alpha/beta hydrolase [Actinomycetota bacterium]